MIAALLFTILVAQDPPATIGASPVPTPSAAPIPAGAAVIRNSGSTNAAPYAIVLVPGGDATIVADRAETHARLAAPQSRWLFYELGRGKALDSFPAATCVKSASFGTSTTIAWNGHQSPDLSCPGIDPALREFARIADVIAGRLGVRVRRPLRRQLL